MGKALSFMLALADLGLLALMVAVSHTGVIEDMGLFTGFVVLAVISWLVALGVALYRAIRFNLAWRWPLALILLFWLPTLPALCYGASGALDMVVLLRRGPSRSAGRTVGARAARPVARPGLPQPASRRSLATPGAQGRIRW